MTTFFNINQVELLCSCFNRVPVYRLYFCRHCLDIRCSKCVSHEVDAYFCPQCMENMATAEAKTRKHRCRHCYDCPSCGSLLIKKATLAMEQDTEDPTKQVAHKVYYFVCGCCRWSTKDVNIPEMKQPNSACVEKPNPFTERIKELRDCYFEISQLEKRSKEKERYVAQRNTYTLYTRFPSLKTMRKTPPTLSSGADEPRKELPAAEATDDCDFCLDDFLSQEVNLLSLTNLKQRHAIPNVQPVSVLEMEPLQKRLCIKRSMRCRVCEHNLSKADFNPSCTKFRINLCALLHLPEVRLSCPSKESSQSAVPLPEDASAAELEHNRSHPPVLGPLHARLVHWEAKVGQQSDLELLLSNPAEHAINVRLTQLTLEEEYALLVTQTLKPVTSSKAGAEEQSAEPMEKPEEKPEELPDAVFSTVALELPVDAFEVPTRTDVPGFDLGTAPDQSPKDLPSFVTSKKSNKLSIRVKMTPKPVNKTDGRKFAPLKAAVRLCFNYHNPTRNLLLEKKAAALKAATSAAPEPGTGGDSLPKEQIHQVSFILLLDLGDMPIAN